MTADTVRSLLEDYESENGAEYAVDDSAKQRLMSLCNLADALSDEFCADSVDVYVSPAQKHGVIAIEVDEIVFKQGRRHHFFTDIMDSDFLRFSKAESGALLIELGVKDLWVTS